MERLNLGMDGRDHARPLTPQERSLRRLVTAMHNDIHVELTPDLIRGLAIVIEEWPPVDGATPITGADPETRRRA